jgi:hypothetical protein
MIEHPIYKGDGWLGGFNTKGCLYGWLYSWNEQVESL